MNTTNDIDLAAHPELQEAVSRIIRDLHDSGDEITAEAVVCELRRGFDASHDLAQFLQLLYQLDHDLAALIIERAMTAFLEVIKQQRPEIRVLMIEAEDA